MTPFEVYCLYTNLKLHFTKPEYDFIKYQGKSRLKFSSFEGRSDKIFFQKLAKHDDPKGLLLANLVLDSKLWIQHLAYSAEAENVYKLWTKRQQALLYYYKEDISKLPDPFEANFKMEGLMHPRAMRLWVKKEMSLETLCILWETTACWESWDKKMGSDPVYRDMRFRVTKYLPFLSYDKESAKKITLERCKASAEA
jgi:hypothetical protein